MFINYNEDHESFHFRTTKFSGVNTESSTLIPLTEMGIYDDPHVSFANINLFPEKILNLQGREIVLSLFNYMPYVLWNEVVSITKQNA